MILKTACALVALLLEVFNMYGDGVFTWYNGYVFLLLCLFLFNYVA